GALRLGPASDEGEPEYGRAADDLDDRLHRRAGRRPTVAEETAEQAGAFVEVDGDDGVGHVAGEGGIEGDVDDDPGVDRAASAGLDATDRRPRTAGTGGHRREEPGGAGVATGEQQPPSGQRLPPPAAVSIDVGGDHALRPDGHRSAARTSADPSMRAPEVTTQVSAPGT